MSGSRYDVVIVGAGANGLAAATRLAAAGRKVLVLERRPTVGGLCAALEIHPGYRVPGILHDEGLVAPRVAAALDLERHGLEWRDAPAVLLAEEGGPGILIGRDPAGAEGELRSRSARDADAYREYRNFLSTLRPLVEGVMTAPPPPLSPAGTGDLWALARRALPLLRLGRRQTLELLRVAPMCVADFLNERFATPLLVEGLAAPAVIGTFAGPWSAGTTTNLLLHEAAPGRHVAGGPAALVSALERAARAAGAEVRTGAEVSRLELQGGRVVGVSLAAREGGAAETIGAGAVLATCDPKRTFLDLIPPGSLPLRLEEELHRVRARGTAAKLHLALDGPLELAARPGQRPAAIRIGGGHVDELERAFDAVKYRQVSAEPHLEIRVPSVEDPSLAPPGHHVVSILASYTPHDLEGGWGEEARAALRERVLARLERHAPGVRGRIVAQQLLTPADLAEQYALTAGQLHHVEPALDQLLMMRPSAATARYATAVPGLYIGGSGSHGGGGAGCTAGWLAAAAVR